MKRFFKNHYEKVLIVIAVIFFIVLLGYIVWGIRFIAMSFDTAITTPNEGDQEIRFNINEAAEVLGPIQ